MKGRKKTLREAMHAKAKARVSVQRRRAQAFASAGKAPVVAAGAPTPIIASVPQSANVLTPGLSAKVVNATAVPNPTNGQGTTQIDYNNLATSVTNAQCDQFVCTVSDGLQTNFKDVSFRSSVTFDPRSVITGLGPSGGNGALIRATAVGTVADGISPILNNSPVTAPQLVLKSLGGMFSPVEVNASTFRLDVPSNAPVNVTSITVLGTATFAGNVTLTAAAGSVNSFANVSASSSFDFGNAKRVSGSGIFDMLSPATSAGQLLVGTGTPVQSGPNVVAFGPNVSDQASLAVLVSDTSQPQNLAFASLGAVSNVSLTDIIPTSIAAVPGDLLRSTGVGPNFWGALTLPTVSQNQPVYISPATGSFVVSPSLNGVRFPVADFAGSNLTLTSTTAEVFSLGRVSFGPSFSNLLTAPTALRVGAGLVSTQPSVTFNASTSPANVDPGSDPASILTADGTLHFPKGRQSAVQHLSFVNFTGLNYGQCVAELSFVTPTVVKAVFSAVLFADPAQTTIPISSPIDTIFTPSLCGKGGGHCCTCIYTDGGSRSGVLDVAIESGIGAATFSINRRRGHWGDFSTQGPPGAGTELIILATTMFWTVSAPMIPHYPTVALTDNFGVGGACAVSGTGDWIVCRVVGSVSPFVRARAFQVDKAGNIVNSQQLVPAGGLSTTAGGGGVAIDRGGQYLSFGDTNGLQAGVVGSVWVFQRTGTTWSQVQLLQAPTSPNSLAFGVGIAFGGASSFNPNGILAVSNGSTVPNASDRMNIYSIGTWAVDGFIAGCSPACAASADGLSVVSGTSLSGGTSFGGVALYTRTGAGWQRSVITPTAPGIPGGAFTCAISSDGRIIAAIGGVAPNQSLYVFRNGVLSQTLALPGGPTTDPTIAMTDDGSCLFTAGVDGTSKALVNCYRSQGGLFVPSVASIISTTMPGAPFLGAAQRTGSCVVLSTATNPALVTVCNR